MTMRPDEWLDRLARHADLGHVQKNQAFVRQVAFLCSSPGTTAPQAAGGQGKKPPLAHLMSLYRFVENDGNALSDLRRARREAVLDGFREGSDLVVIHDMSPLDYCRHNSKADRRAIGDGRGMGYEYVDCLAVDPRTARIMGVIHDTVVNKEGPDDRDMMNYDYEPLFADFSEEDKKALRENHRHQMAVHINGTTPWLLPYHVIDVADREFDDLFVLDRCRQKGRDFVIRSCAHRNVQIRPQDWMTEGAFTGRQSGHPLEPGHRYAQLKKLVEQAPLRPYKRLPLDAHNRVVEESAAKRFAELSIGAFSVVLYRNAMRNYTYIRPVQPVTVNVVVIREPDPPVGVEGVCWVLFTSLPIETFEQLAYIGRLYEMRWLIEVYHRLLKSGYGIERSRFEDAERIARYLVLLSMAAMAVLTLKAEVGLGSQGTLKDEEYRRIKRAMLETNNGDIPLRDRLFAYVARTGGWLGRRRDPIGPTILMRGILHLMAALAAYGCDAALLEEASRNLEEVRHLLGYRPPADP